jgi:uncharacterized protein (DUF1697 family)
MAERSKSRKNSDAASYAALLRGVNVGGRGKVAMEDLRGLFEALGFTDVASYVQSGNIVFTSGTPIKDTAELARTIEHKVSKDLGVESSVLIKSGDELRTILQSNPLVDRTDDPAKLHVTFLAQKPDAEHLAKLPEGGDGTDELVVVGQEVYLFCPGGYGNSKLNNTFIEKRLAVRATTRNWRTVTKLVEMTL